MKLSNASIPFKAAWARFAIGFLFLLLAAWPSLSIRESLWVDELHSAWVILGQWDEVGQRASAGNQSPGYFYALKAWSSLFESFLTTDNSAEIVLRMSSMLGWTFLCCTILATIFGTVPRRAIIATSSVVVGWLLLDRIGAFYAIELRPYIWVTLVSLFVMLSGVKLANQPNRIGYAWLFSSVLVFYLHYTSIIIVALSWLGGMLAVAIGWREWGDRVRSQIIRLRVFEILILALLFSPGLWQLRSISKKSQQWASFAGDASFTRVVDLIPWLSWSLVPMIAFLVYRWLRKTMPVQQSNQTQPQLAWLLQLSVVGYGSLILVWALTYFEIAPLLHRRYILGAYPAFVLLGAFWLGRIPSLRVLLLTGLLSAGLMIWWQGTIGEWRDGRWIAWQRQEDWRGAVAYLNDHRKTEEPILLAPMLIETKGSKVDSSIDSSYLKYALTSLYELDDSDSIRLLPNDRSSWASEVDRIFDENGDHSIWIVARVGNYPPLDTAFTSETPLPEEKETWLINHFFRGGHVQVWKLDRGYTTREPK